MPLEFEAEAIGLQSQCPYCRKQTELRLATPAQEPLVPRRAILWTLVAVLILGLGAAGIFLALQRAQNLAERAPQKSRPGQESPAR